MSGAYFIIVFIQLFCFTGASASGIVGGKESKPHSRPYMASLQYDRQHSCGGVLIREDFVLTAAHCLQSNKKMIVVLGAHNISKTEASQQSIHVAKYFPHPCYANYDNDIMLLKLRRKAKQNNNVRVLGLPRKPFNITRLVNCLVVGWGKTGANKPPSDVLRETTEKLQFDFECKNLWKNYFNIQHMFCTFDKKKGGICQGDSGGPLMCERRLMGLASYTDRNDCTNSKLPHVFMNIHFYLPWIQTIMTRSGNAVPITD